VPLDRESRARGGRNRQRNARLGKAVRGVAREELAQVQKTFGPLDDVGAAITYLRWWFEKTATAEVDPATGREGTRILTALKELFKIRDYQRRLRELEQLVKQYEREQVHR
jgi:hypothetical protein